MNMRIVLRRAGIGRAMLLPAVTMGIALALGAALLTWINLQHSVRLVPTELYITVIAIAFTVLGIWAGHGLTAARRAGPGFTRNEAALASLGITAREFEVLTHIAAGHTNKQIARDLGISPNTVKTQAASLFARLGAARRTDAVAKARALAIIP
jgi:DNA-binding CsgD family transcriptional regulator